MPMTSRVIWKVRLYLASSSKLTHCHGETQSRPMGPTAAGLHQRTAPYQNAARRSAPIPRQSEMRALDMNIRDLRRYENWPIVTR